MTSAARTFPIKVGQGDMALTVWQLAVSAVTWEDQRHR